VEFSKLSFYSSEVNKLAVGAKQKSRTILVYEFIKELLLSEEIEDETLLFLLEQLSAKIKYSRKEKKPFHVY
jgi:hypothetical protein